MRKMNTCRLCLSSCRDPSQDYLEQPDLASKIRTHLAVEVENTTLPTIICKNCVEKLQQFNTYYKNVEKNQLLLQKKQLNSKGSNKRNKYEDGGGIDPERIALENDCKAVGLNFDIASVIYDNLKSIRSQKKNDTEAQTDIVKEENDFESEDNFAMEENEFVTEDDNFVTENDNSLKEENEFVTEHDSFVTENDNSLEEEDFVTKDDNIIDEDDNFVTKDDNVVDEDDDFVTKDDNFNKDDNFITQELDYVSESDTKEDSGDEYEPKVHYKHQIEYARTRELPQRKAKRSCNRNKVIKFAQPITETEEQHKCLTCLEFKGSKWVLLKHYKTEHGPTKEKAQEKYRIETLDTGKVTYKCTQCDEVLLSETKILKHLEHHEQNRPYACKICGECTMYRVESIQHIPRDIASHDDGPKYFCSLQCGYSTSHPYTLKAHEKRHEKVYKYKCAECNKGYDTRTDYEEHQNIHSGVKPFKCNQCDKAFTRRTYLQAHKLKMHSNRKLFACMHCSHPCANKHALRKHLKDKHGVSTRVQCDLCGITLCRSDQLPSHMRACLGIRPYSCSYCPKTFSKKYGLTLHLRTHTGDRKFKCDKCGRSYTQHWILTRHPCKPKPQRNQAASNRSSSGKSVQDTEQ